jgi:GMP synthase (glutamine-hydrolysing)
MAKTALVLRHVHFEDLGSFARPLQEAGYGVRCSDVDDPDFCAGDPRDADLLIVLGGPVGVYEDTHYPFIAAELDFIRTRLQTRRPTLGICLGAQFIALALGAGVYPMSQKEIGFSTLTITEEGLAGPLRHLADVEVLHWHGDTYTLPWEAWNLASTALAEQQAFAIGRHVLGLQFHPEAETDHGFERWLVGHAVELVGARIDSAILRWEGVRHGQALRTACRSMLTEWLEGLET